jgi:hypothetical protein
LSEAQAKKVSECVETIVSGKSKKSEDGQSYVDAVCACKDSKCIDGAATTHAESAKGLSKAQAIKVSECVAAIVEKEAE